MSNLVQPPLTTPVTVTNGTVDFYKNHPWVQFFEGIYFDLNRPDNFISIKDYGAKGDGVQDETKSIQAAINAASPNSMVWFPPGQYKVTSQLSVTNNCVFLVGAGARASTIIFAPTANGTCLKIAQNPVSSDLAQGGIIGLTFYSFDSTFHKTAINVVAVTNYVIRDVFVWGNVGGAYWSDSTFGSIALQTNGHELTTVSNFYTFSDSPIVIGPNPISTLSLDQWNFTDCTLAAQNNPCVFVQDNVGLTNVNFTGRQSWSGGTYGFKWINTIGVSSYYGLNFENVRWEQASSGGGWCFYINFYKPGVAISSVSRTGGLTCTATVPLNSGFVAGGQVTITGVLDPGFDGAALPVTSYSGTTLVYSQAGPTTSSSGGTATPSNGGNTRQLTMTNLYLVPEQGSPLNGLYLRNVSTAVLTNVFVLISGVALDVDVSDSDFILWNSWFGLMGSTMNLGTPAFNDFILYAVINGGGASGTGTDRTRFSVKTFDLTSEINIPYQASLGSPNRTGVGKRMIGIGTVGPLNSFIGIDPDAIGVVTGTGSMLRIGGYTGPTGPITGIVLPNAVPLHGANSTGTGSNPMIEFNASNQIEIGPGGGGAKLSGPVEVVGNATFDAAVQAPSINYIATENGANNAIACAASSGPALTTGLTVWVKLAHTLQAGANTFAYNGGTALAIVSHRNTASNIGTGYTNGIIQLVYDGTQWEDLSQ